MKNKVLLILSTTKKSLKSVETAIKIAEEKKAEIITMVIVDEYVSTNAIKKLSEDGWIGGTPSDNLYEAIEKEYTMQAKTIMLEIEPLLKSSHLSYRGIIKKGNFVQEILDFIEKENITDAIVPGKERSAISRFLFGSGVTEIKKKAKCNIEVIGE